MAPPGHPANRFKDLDRPRRCTSLSSDGSGRRCNHDAMMGQKVCWKHGGKAPQAIAAARLRLLQLADPAIKNLHDKTQSDDHRVSLSASKAILDRAGIGPKGSLELEGGLAVEVNDRLSGKDLPLPVRRLLLALAEGWKMPDKFGRIIEKWLPEFKVGEE